MHKVWSTIHRRTVRTNRPTPRSMQNSLFGEEKMTLITIQDLVCWRCGKPFDQTDPELSRTMHHTIPQSLNPVHNIIVPIHEKCHKEITSQDISSLASHAYRLGKQTEQLTGSVEGLNSMIAKHNIIKVKKNA